MFVNWLFIVSKIDYSILSLTVCLSPILTYHKLTKYSRVRSFIHAANMKVSKGYLKGAVDTVVILHYSGHGYLSDEKLSSISSFRMGVKLNKSFDGLFQIITSPKIATLILLLFLTVALAFHRLQCGIGALVVLTFSRQDGIETRSIY